MFRLPLPFRDSALLMDLQWDGLTPWVQYTLIGLVCLIPVVLILWLYRYELKLVPPGVALGLLTLRLVTVALILFLVCLQPIYARDRYTELPGRVVVGVDRSASLDVADVQRTPEEKLRLARALRLHQGVCSDEDLNRLIEGGNSANDQRGAEDRRKRDELVARVDELTRSRVAQLLLAPEGAGLLDALRKKHRVDLIGFHREAWSNVEGQNLADLFTRRRQQGEKPAENPDGVAKPTQGQQPRGEEYTDLRLPLIKALERPVSEEGKLLGVVLLTEGQHNFGEPPVRKALELGKHGAPVYPVALGSRRPPSDVAVTTVTASHTVFKGVEAPVTVDFRVTGLPEQDIVVELLKAGREDKGPIQEKVIRHDGKQRDYQHRFQVRMDEVGTQGLIARVRPTLPGTKETHGDNNSWPVLVNVADDKAKVLVIDGEARWEYHYLATALQRDPTMRLDRVVFHQPRIERDLTPQQLRQLGSPDEKLPEGPDALADFDCIILGDVPADDLPFPERQRLEKYVAERGGTLVILAGKRSMPVDFPELAGDGEPDPLRKLLPVEDLQVYAPEDGFQVTLTTHGKEQRFMQMASDPEKDRETWEGLPAHYWAVLGKAKPGATTLAYAPDRKAKPENAEEDARRRALMAMHHYGFGRVLYVGLDSTWRWRFKVGDRHHHRFWGQAIRWAAAEKPLVTGNEYVRFGAPRPVYVRGESIDLVVRFNEEAGEIKPGLLAAARILQKGDDGKEEAVAVVQLGRRAAQPRVLEGQVRDLPPGQYEIELVIPDMADKLFDAGSLPGAANQGTDPKTLRARFTVTPSPSREMIDLETRWPLLEEIASKSGGKVFTPEDAGHLIDLLTQQQVVKHERHDQPLWQWWVTLAVVLSFMTVEWIARKWAGLS